MGEPAVRPEPWWHAHRLPAPARTPHMSWAVMCHPWGVAVWEGPTVRAPWAPLRVVEVIVTDPDAPMELALDHAADRIPSRTRSRRVARALPFPASERGVQWATAVLVVLPLVAASAGPWALLLLPPLLALVFLVADRLPPQGPAALRRQGHAAGQLPCSPPVVHADAICAAAQPTRFAPQVVRALRIALWECRHDDPVGHSRPTRLGRWVADVGDAFDAAREIDRHAAAYPDSATTRHAAAMLPEQLAAMASDREDRRRGVVEHLREVRGACAESAEARTGLDRTVRTGAAPAEIDPGAAADGVDEETFGHDRERWAEVLRELRAESEILREVDAELRARDGQDPDPGRGRD